MVFGRPHLFAGGFSWNAIVKNFTVLCFLVPCDWACFLCFIPMLDCVFAGSTAGFQYERFVRARAMGVPSVFSFCSPMDHRPNLLCWDKRL